MMPMPMPRPAPAADLAPLPAKDFDVRAAQHLLARAGFGGTLDQARALAAMGLDRAVDALVDYEPFEYAAVKPGDFDRDLIRPLTDAERTEIARARREKDEAVVEAFQKRENEAKAADRRQLVDMRKWWITRMIETPRPLEEKMTLFWHGHFATGFRTIEDSWHLFQQNQLFRSHATGSFADLVLEVIRDPAMLRYLDNNQNRKARPNENLARELLELFILGEGNGYTEQDIKEGARALTGYTYRDDEFTYRAGDHDPAPKTIFGQQGNWNGDEFARLALNRKACSEFLCGKLYRFFVNDGPDRPADERAAQQAFTMALARCMRDNQYAMKPVLKALFRSAHFFDRSNRASIIKSPVQVVVQTIRQYRTPPRQLSALAGACELMGQDMFQPPNVKGWDGGRAWINTATMFVRQNVAIYLLTGRRPDVYDWENDDEKFDALALVEDLRAGAAPGAAAAAPAIPAEAAVDRLLAISLAGRPHPARRAELLGFVGSAPIDADRTLALLALITALPEYQLC
jgi:uncharacterized protein (DUF1800 family)